MKNTNNTNATFSSRYEQQKNAKTTRPAPNPIYRPKQGCKYRRSSHYKHHRHLGLFCQKRKNAVMHIELALSNKATRTSKCYAMCVFTLVLD